MKFNTNYLISDDNVEWHKANPGGRCGTLPRQEGYGATDAADADIFLEDIIDYAEWPKLIAEQELTKSSLEHLWRDCGMGVLNQEWTMFCWFNSVAGALMIERALMGLPFVRLSPSSGAAPINGFQNVGGWITNAIRWAKIKGIASADYVPMNTCNPHDFRQGWQENALQHRVSRARDIPGQDQILSSRDNPSVQRRVSAHQIQGSFLLNNKPMPNEIMWMEHSMLSLRVIDKYTTLPANDYRRYQIRDLNSWGSSDGDHGFRVREGRQQVANHGYCLELAAITGTV